jgi:predicted PurR-regulated permease PerM
MVHRNTGIPMTRPDEIIKTSWMSTLASTAIVIAALYLAKSLLVPLTLAALLSFLLMPVCDWLERRRLGRIPAVLVTAILGFTMLGVMAWVAVVQMTHLAPKIPEYQNNIQTKLSSVNQYAAAALSKLTKKAAEVGQNPLVSEHSAEPLGTDELPFSVRVLSSPVSPLQVFGGMFGTLLETLGTIGIVIVLVVFFLIRREDLRDRFIHLVGKGHVTLTTQMLEDANLRVSRYLSMLFLVNVTFGISVGIGLYLIGVPSAILWGILAAALRFIPYIGPWIAAAMPIGLSMAISSGWVTPILTVGLFIALELFSNNVLEPWLYGKNTGVSAVAVLVAAVFWLWLWGPVGLLLATPLTVCLLVVGKHVPQLSFLDVLLGNEPVFEPKKRIYQRLVAGDQEEADELLEELLGDRPLVDVYDTVLIPALASAETHWHRGEVDDGKHKFILQSLKEMIQDRIDRQQETQAQERTEGTQVAQEDSGHLDQIGLPRLSILSLPARSEADEIAAMMLAQVLETKGCVVQAVSVTSLATEMVNIVEQHNADVICVSATPPGAMMHARYLCKQLRRRFPKVKVVVGLWDMQGDLNKAKERIGCGATVIATMADAQEQIRLLLQQLLLQIEQQPRPEDNEVLIARAHPSNYPSNINVGSAHQLVPAAHSVDSGNSVSN